MKFTLKANIRQIFNRNLLFSLRLIIKQQFKNMLSNPTRAPKKIYEEQEYFNSLVHLIMMNTFMISLKTIKNDVEPFQDRELERP